MHLTKLFNWHYLKQNMKKSKGVILLFLILVPVFTALVTMLSVHNISFVKVANPIELVWVNIIGLYIIPFVLSFTLFGYVYKRTSVDFINSMPINRKTIFITNTIGGIILIAIIQCVTALILWLCSMMFPHYVIFTSFIVDILIMMFVSYVFVFLVANLAMTISGTFLTQIVLTMLILFFIPFLMDTYHQFSQSETYRFLNGNTEFQHQVEVNKTEYTMPYRIFSIMVYGNDTKLYYNKSIDKMLLLGAIYFVLGMYLFYKRKMENTEESFASTSIHLIIKALTIFPMIVILNQIEAEMEWNIVLIALVIVYYFLFDLIVKKKVTFPVSIVGIVATLFILQEHKPLRKYYLKKR